MTAPETAAGLVEEAVRELATHLGMKLGDSQAAGEIAAKVVEQLTDAISARAWRDAKAAGDAAAAGVTTLEQAEASARRPR